MYKTIGQLDKYSLIKLSEDFYSLTKTKNNRDINVKSITLQSRNNIVWTGKWSERQKELALKLINRDISFKNAILNAKDCLKYGYGKDIWIDCGIPKSSRDYVWDLAKNELAKEF